MPIHWRSRFCAATSAVLQSLRSGDHVLLCDDVYGGTFRIYDKVFKQFGIGDFADLRSDPGRFAMTHDEADRGRFRTPSLLEVARTAPYMHNGIFTTLEDVVRFYDNGGGGVQNKDVRMQPLNLTEDEIGALVAFLQRLGSDEPPFDVPDPAALPPYELRTLGAN